MARRVAPANMRIAPPRTVSQRNFPASRSSLKRSVAPEDAEETVDVPEREGDAEADVANGEDGERVGDGPEAACEDAPDDEVRCLANVDAHLPGAADESREAPAGEEDADDHQQRNDERRDPKFY